MKMYTLTNTHTPKHINKTKQKYISKFIVKVEHSYICKERAMSVKRDVKMQAMWDRKGNKKSHNCNSYKYS